MDGRECSLRVEKWELATQNRLKCPKEITMLELIAKTIGTAVASGVAKEVASHSGDFVDGALEVAGDTIEFAGDCVCGILDGIGSLFD